jgi:hypothetical protein
MFNIFKRKEPRPAITAEELDLISSGLIDSMIEEMEDYDVLFYDVWPPLRVPASRILKDLKDAGYNIPDLIRSFNGTCHNCDKQPRFVEVERRNEGKDLG